MQGAATANLKSKVEAAQISFARKVFFCMGNVRKWIGRDLRRIRARCRQFEVSNILHTLLDTILSTPSANDRALLTYTTAKPTSNRHR